MGEKRYLALTYLLMVAFVRLAAQSVDSLNYQLKDFPFVFISEDYNASAPQISDSLFDVAARGIRFQVNRTELQPDDPFIKLYREQLVPWLKSQDMELRWVFIKGAASPEGPYDNNVRLSRGRTQRLIEFMNREMGEPMSEQFLTAQNIVEDYGLLVKKMQQAADRDYARVRDVWQECHGDEACCKQRLMALDNGQLWQRLKNQYFPGLRQARVVLWFTRNKPIMEEAKLLLFPKEVIETPNIKLDIPAPELKYARRHLIAARTNLVHDLLYVPQFGFAYGANIQLEYYPLDGHYTYNAGFTFTNHRHWQDNKFFQIRDLQLELRRYFRGGGVFLGPYLGLYAEGTVYGIGFSKSKGWQGEGGGGGVSLGYTMPLNRKGSLRLELSASVGFFYTRYDPYVYGNPLVTTEDGLYYYDYTGNTSDFKKRNHQFTWLGPTNAGIHLTYDIIYRKKKLVSSGLQKGGNR